LHDHLRSQLNHFLLIGTSTNIDICDVSLRDQRLVLNVGRFEGGLPTRWWYFKENSIMHFSRFLFI